jgi:PAS domain S-box-containing protein
LPKPSSAHNELIEENSTLKQRIRELEQSESKCKLVEEEKHKNQGTTERLANELAIVAEIGRVISSTLSIDEVYEQFASITRKLIPVDTLSVNLIDVPQNLFRIAHISGLDLPGRTIGRDIPLNGSMTEYVMRKQKAMMFNASNIEELSRLHPGITRRLSIQAGFQSNMLIPLFSNDAIIGVLHFRAKKHNAYSEADLRLAERIGMQIAGAIANAQLFKDLSKTEKSLRESEGRFRTLVEQAAVGVAEINMATGHFLTVNHRLCEMVGMTEGELLATTFQAITHPEDLHLHKDKTVLLLAGKIGYYNLEKRYIRKDGATIWVNITVSPLWKQGENPGRNMIVVEDITERKQAENALRDSEERHRRLIEALSDAVLLRSKDIVIYANPAAFKLFRANHTGDLIGKRYLDLVHPDDRAISAERVKKSVDENSIAPPREHRMMDLDRQVVHVESTGVPFKYRGETQVFGVFRDITERKQAEEEKSRLQDQLLQAQKMEALGHLAGGVAHDLNNVLGILSGYSELLLLEIPEGHRSRGHAEKILQSTEKAAAIIQDLLTLARRGVMVSGVINLNTIVSGFLQTPVFEKMKDYHPCVTFRTDCDKNLLNIKGSTVHLEKALMNLVSNAAESISGKGEVTIRTENRYLDTAIQRYDEVKQGDYAVLTVSDTGMGIPVEDRERIFEPFYTKKTMGRSGTGLGLAIVWGTVKDHNGYIDLQTEVGQGTTFTLYFPVTREEQIAPQQKMQIEQYMGKGESVLVVDDVPEQRDVAAGLLTRIGYEVQVVSSGEMAADYLKGNKADILVLDMIMTPGIDGLETYQRVLEINPKQKAILVSGFSETVRVQKAQELGAGAYVKKPYLMEKIGVAVRKELDRK